MDCYDFAFKSTCFSSHAVFSMIKTISPATDRVFSHQVEGFFIKEDSIEVDRINLAF